MNTPKQTSHSTQVDKSSWIPLVMVPGTGNETAPSPATLERPIQILLVDDHPVILYGLASTLSSYPNLRIVGEATNGQEAVLKARELAPDIVVMDIDMPGMGGSEAMAAIQRESPAMKFLVLTISNRRELLERMLKDGASGYVLKNAPLEDLVRAIQMVHAAMPPVASESPLDEPNPEKPGARPGRRPATLSRRERELIVAVAEGLSNKEIAALLGLTMRTVETYRQRVFRKLNVHGTVGLTKYAVQMGLVPAA